MSDSHVMPGSKVGVVNCGSSSIKYECVRPAGVIDNRHGARGTDRECGGAHAAEPEGKNSAVAGKAAELKEKGCPVRVLAVRTDEELEIALQAERSWKRGRKRKASTRGMVLRRQCDKIFMHDREMDAPPAG